jgi:transcriptional regulator with XRE-family HTH domain
MKKHQNFNKMNKDVLENEDVVSEVDAVHVSPEELGDRVRKLRSERGLTIAELADRADLSVGLISQIERGRSNPSVRTLQRLRSALGVNLWEFLQPPSSTTAVGWSTTASSTTSSTLPYIRHQAERQTLVVGKSRLVKELLSPRSDDPLRFMLITIPAGGESEDVLQSQGHKGGYMLSGRACLTVGSVRGDLGPGDSFQFPADIPHKISNPYGEPATLVWIMSIVDAHL